MEEIHVIAIPQEAKGAMQVRLASEEEISRMSDLQAIEKVDELRGAARSAAGMGLDEEARTLYANACDIVEHNLIVPETIGEYADLLEAQGLVEPAAEYRAWHEEFMANLAEYNLPARGYEERLRAEVAQGKESAKEHGLPTHANDSRERLGTAMAEAQQAAHGLAPSSSQRLMPAETRGVQ